MATRPEIPSSDSAQTPAPALSASDERFFELSLDLVCVVGFDGYLKRVNPAWERQLGWSPEELLAEPYAVFLHPEDRQATAEEAASLAEPGRETRDFEMRFQTRSGEFRNLLWMARADEDGTAILAVGRDITDRKRDEAALRDAERRFRAVTESVNDAIVSAGEDGRIMFWNQAAQRMFGLQAEQVQGAPLTMLMPERYRQAHRDGLARLQRTGEPRVLGRTTVELDGLRGDGSEFPMELSLGSWVLGERTFYTGVIRDIAERRRAQSQRSAQLAVGAVLVENPPLEEAFPALLEAIGTNLGWEVGGVWRPDEAAGAMRCAAYWAADPPSTVPFERMTRTLSLARGKGLPGRVWESASAAWVLDVTVDPNFPRAPVARQAGLQAAVGLPVVESDEVLVVMEFFTARLRPPDEELESIMSTICAQVGHFVRRKQAEAALAAAGAELEARAADLERSNAELAEFAYVASHDLSEPLRQVRGFVELLRQRYHGQLDDDADEFIGFAVDGVERMRALIDDLLAYSRVGRERPEGPVETAAALSQARAALSGSFADRGAELEIGELPVVLADERELAQLFQNLLSNALKFCSGTPRIRVGARRDGRLCRFSVDDNGIGIEPRHAERIFKMFGRLHGRDEFPGTGIGLAICKKIVERHGGEISVGASPLGGSSFTFTLPGAPEPGP